MSDHVNSCYEFIQLKVVSALNASAVGNMLKTA